jgi:hypothetical protein
MFVFTTWFSDIIDPRYQECLNTIRLFYPELVTINKCEPIIADHESYQVRSDITRFAVLKEHDDVLYLDSDIKMKQKIEFPDLSKPVFHGKWDDPDICMIRSVGHKDWFVKFYEDLLKANYRKIFEPQHLIRTRLSQVTLFQQHEGVYKHLVMSTRRK